MRPILISLCAVLPLLACTERDSRPAKEAIAQAKGAAVDAKETVRATAQDAKQTAEAAAATADRAVNDASRAVQNGVETAAETTRSGAENVAQGVRELGAGGVVTGRVSTFSSARLALRTEGAGPAQLRVDDRTRYILHGGALGRASLPVGTRVKATYVVEAQVPTATEVEVLGH